MSTIVNNPGDGGRNDNNNLGWVIAIVALLILLFLIFFVFADDTEVDDRIENVPQQVQNFGPQGGNGSNSGAGTGSGSGTQGSASIPPTTIINSTTTSTTTVE